MNNANGRHNDNMPKLTHTRGLPGILDVFGNVHCHAARHHHSNHCSIRVVWLLSAVQDAAHSQVRGSSPTQWQAIAIMLVVSKLCLLSKSWTGTLVDLVLSGNAVGLLFSAVGLLISSVGLLIRGSLLSAVGLLISAVGLLISAVGLLVSAVGLLISAVGLLLSAVGLLLSAVGLLISAVGCVGALS
jgi:hypothetical protein